MMKKIYVFIIVLILSFGLFYPFLGSIYELDVKNALMGVDYLGRDNLIKIAYGIRITFLVIVSSVFLELVIGMSILSFLNLEFIFFIMNILLMVPSFIYALFIISILGNSLPSLVFAIAFRRALSFAITMRNEITKLQSSKFVLNARLMGANKYWIFKFHILPNIYDFIILRLRSSITRTIFYEATLSFMGLGNILPYASLGTLAKESYHYIFIDPIPFICVNVLIFLISFSLSNIIEATYAKA